MHTTIRSNKVISENIVTKVNEFKKSHDDFMTSEDLCLLKERKLKNS